MYQSDNSQNLSMLPQSSQQVLSQQQIYFLRDSSSSSDIIRQQINPLQSRRKNTEDSKEMKELYQTGFDSVHLQPSRPLQQVKQQFIYHFNHSSDEQPREIFPKKRQNMKGKRFARAQNLKNITRHIKSLISNNRNLTVKTMANLLYQIMGNTRIGLEIVSSNYPTINQVTKAWLASRYQDQRNVDSSLRSVIKNVRRRLYDALNVMIAASVLEKSKNILRISTFSYGFKPSSNRMISQQQENEELMNQAKRDIFKWNETIRQFNERIARKRKAIEELNKRVGIMRKLINRNRSQRQTSQKPMFLLPLLMIKGVPKMRIFLQSNMLTIKSEINIKILPDMQMLEIIFKHHQLQSRSESGNIKRLQ